MTSFIGVTVIIVSLHGKRTLTKTSEFSRNQIIESLTNLLMSLVKLRQFGIFLAFRPMNKGLCLEGFYTQVL